MFICDALASRLTRSFFSVFRSELIPRIPIMFKPLVLLLVIQDHQQICFLLCRLLIMHKHRSLGSIQNFLRLRILGRPIIFVIICKLLLILSVILYLAILVMVQLFLQVMVRFTCLFNVPMGCTNLPTYLTAKCLLLSYQLAQHHLSVVVGTEPGVLER